ncbi:MAG: ABC transporter ATP-binding protein [Acidimicrobiales bacterium]
MSTNGGTTGSREAGPALVAAGLRKSYETDRDIPVRALRGLDLTVQPGEFVAVAGASGCGKSTLLNVVAGLETADEGTVRVADEDVTGQSEDVLAHFRRRHIGMVFQMYNLLDELSVEQNVALPAMLGGRKRKAAEARARDLLSLLGLADRAGASPSVLSGGQRQRLAIARALANDPTLLLADEPTGALDSEGSAEIAELFRRLNRDGQTIILVTHDANVAAQASRVAVMADGVIVDDQATATGGRGAAAAT